MYEQAKSTIGCLSNSWASCTFAYVRRQNLKTDNCSVKWRLASAFVFSGGFYAQFSQMLQPSLTNFLPDNQSMIMIYDSSSINKDGSYNGVGSEWFNCRRSSCRRGMHLILCRVSLFCKLLVTLRPLPVTVLDVDSPRARREYVGVRVTGRFATLTFRLSIQKRPTCYLHVVPPVTTVNSPMMTAL